MGNERGRRRVSLAERSRWSEAFDRDADLEVFSLAAIQPDYRQRQDYQSSDTVPVVIEGREVARLTVQDLLP
jgi:hypothetical protein